MSNIVIYNKNHDPIADLGEATDVSYTKQLNEPWSASFSLPADNKKTDMINLMDFAEVFDGEKRIELFRIDERHPERTGEETNFRYECTHVLDTLNDDYCAMDKVPKRDENGNIITDDNGDPKSYTNLTKTGGQSVIEWVLDQQGTHNWNLGDFEFNKSFEYEFYQNTLLKALLKIPQPWWEDFQITFDTTSHPWTLNIVKPDVTPKAEFKYSKNLKSIEKEENAKDMVTKLYAYGSGSGEERMAAGPFTSDPASYGTYVGVWEEQFFDNQAELANAAQKYLTRKDTPRTIYRGEAADLYRLTETNNFELGTYILIEDTELGIDNKVRVTKLSKNGLRETPSSLDIELNNKSRRFPDYGALAFKDEATEDNLAPGSVSGVGGGGALASGGVGTDALASEAVTWGKFDTGLKNSSGEQITGTRLSINAQTVFETDYDPQQQWPKDTLAPDAYKVRGKTVIEGGYIDTGLIDTDAIRLEQVAFSPVESDEVIASINVSSEKGLTIDADRLAITSHVDDNSSSITQNASEISTNVTGIASNQSSISQNASEISSNVTDIEGNSSSITQNADKIATNVSDINGNESSITQNATNISTNISDIDGNTTNITQNANEISTLVEDIDGNSSSITQNADQISTNVSDIDGNSSSITQNANQIQTNVTDIDGNSSTITQNANEIDLRVKKGSVMSFINVTSEAIDINASNQLELQAGGTINIDATNGVEVDESKINLEAGQINITGLTTLDSWQYSSSTTIDGGEIEADTLKLNDILIDNDIDMAEGGGINSILNCESITGNGGSPAIVLAGNDVGITGATLTGALKMNSYKIDMGGGNITNVGTVDGVDISGIDTSGYTDSDAVSAIENEISGLNVSLSDWSEKEISWNVSDLKGDSYEIMVKNDFEEVEWVEGTVITGWTSSDLDYVDKGG